MAFRPDGIHRGEDGFALEHHAFFAAERPVVHRAVAIVSPVAQVMDADVQQAGVLAALHHAMRERSLEELWEDRQHMENHGRFKYFKPSGNSTAIDRKSVV